MKDCTGKVFGQLTVLRDSGIRKHRSVVWVCICECGTEVNVTRNNLITGNTKSCGCLPRGSPPQDLAGQIFGRLTAIKMSDNRTSSGEILWLCECSCSGFVEVRGSNLRNGHTKSCGCIQTYDATGERYGRLVAVYPTNKRSGSSIVWLCICDCGNTSHVASTRLRRGTTKSCGCLARECSIKSGKARLIDQTGHRFGRWTVLRDTGKRSGGHVIWECKCDCGNIVDVNGSNLTNGTSRSCGCYLSEFISSRNKSNTGKDAPNWQGGKSFEEYSNLFNNELKQRIRGRDNNECVICGDFGKCVHHIDYNKQNNSESNLITLCRSCHTKTNYNRGYWQSLLSSYPRLNYVLER